MSDFDTERRLTRARLFPTSRVADRYTTELSTALSSTRVQSPSFAEFRDPDIWWKMRRHPDFEALFQMRRRQFAATSLSVVPRGDDWADQVVASVIEQILLKIKRFKSARYNLAEAPFRGSSYAYVEGKVITWSPTIPSPAGGEIQVAPMQWWVPTRLRHVDRSRVELRDVNVRTKRQPFVHPTGKRTRDLQWHLYSIERKQWEPLGPDTLMVKHTYEDSEDSLGYGRGLIEAMYYSWMVMTTLERDGLQGVARWAQGVLMAKIDGLRQGSKVNSQLATDVLAMLRKTVSRNYQVWDKNDDVTVLPGPGQGHQMVREFRQDFFNSALRLVMGSILPFGGAGDTGSYARAQEEANQSRQYLQFDYDKMAEDLEETLVAPIMRINRAPFSIVTMNREVELPELELTSIERFDPEAQVRVISEALTIEGMALPQAAVHERLGIPRAKPGEAAYSFQSGAPVIAP